MGGAILVFLLVVRRDDSRKGVLWLLPLVPLLVGPFQLSSAWHDLTFPPAVQAAQQQAAAAVMPRCVPSYDDMVSRQVGGLLFELPNWPLKGEVTDAIDGYYTLECGPAFVSIVWDTTRPTVVPPRGDTVTPPGDVHICGLLAETGQQSRSLSATVQLENPARWLQIAVHPPSPAVLRQIASGAQCPPAEQPPAP
jgi:hypothetical protein